MTAARRFSGPALQELAKAKILGVRAGTEHRYTGVWVVVVEGRVFVRSWNDKPTGWYHAFQAEPLGSIELAGREIATVEGLARGGRLHPLQAAFAELGAAQCGYCTPGILVAAKALLDRSPAPTRREVAEWLAGNLCRCTGYLKILEAVDLAAARMRGDAGGPAPQRAEGTMPHAAAPTAAGGDEGGGAR